MTQNLLFDPLQINLPFTVGIIKPDTVLQTAKLAQIIDGIQNSQKLTIKNMLQRELLKQEVLNLLYRHTNKPYFDQLVSYMLSGECCVMILCLAEGLEADPIDLWKQMIGPKNPDDAKKSNPESLRARYGKSIIKNEFFGSDNIADANKERKIFQFRVPQQPPQFKDNAYKITFKSIKQFLQPPNLEHSCINERMDILALYGPIVNWHSIEKCFCNECKPTVRHYCMQKKNRIKAKVLKVLKQEDIRILFDEICTKCQDHCETYTHLIGGRQMQHILTDNEIKQLATEVNRNQLIQMLKIEKGSTAKIMIQKIPIVEPKEIIYNIDFFILLIQQIQKDYYERYDFTELQNLILQDRRIRIVYWVSKLIGKSVDRFPPITTLDNTLTIDQLRNPKSPFYTLNRKLPLSLLIKTEHIKNVPLMYPISIMDKEKLHQTQRNIVVEKKMHRNLTKVTSVGQKNIGIKQAVTLLRPYNEGRHGDWNNYHSLKGNSNKSSIGGKFMNYEMNKQ